MSKGVKILLIVTGLCVIGFAGIIGAGVWWFHSNQAELRAAGEEAQAEGEAFATQSDQAGCRKEALQRSASCGYMGIICNVKQKLFFSACLEHAALTEGFCDGVVARSQIVASALWVAEECENEGRADDQKCAQLLQEHQEFCHQD